MVFNFVVFSGILWYLVVFGGILGSHPYVWYVWYGMVWYGMYGMYGMVCMVWYGMVWYGMHLLAGFGRVTSP